MEILIFFTIIFYVGTFIYSDEALEIAIARNNIFLTKLICDLAKCSQDACDSALQSAVWNNNLEMVKYLVESEKCSDDAIKEALFNQDGTLKEEFNGIKNELIKKYKAQKEWHINKYVIIHNLNKLDNSCITFDQLNIIFKKIFNFESLLSASLIKYLDVHSYLNLVKSSIDSPKRKAIEEEKGDKNTSKQYAPETVDEDFLMRVYGQYLSGKEFWEELKEILLANLSEILKMMEINKPGIEISILEINHPAVTLLSKESIEQQVTLPGLYITDSKGIGMGVTTTSQNLDNTQEIPTLNDETPHHYTQLL